MDINPSTIYLSRIKDFKSTPPDENWDGSFKLDEK